MPLALAVPATTVPLSRFPASVTAPAASAAVEVITGASFVPAIVIVSVVLDVAPCESTIVYVKTSWADAP